MTNDILSWYKVKKWKPLPFQVEAWDRFSEGKSGLISVPTGAGKTYAAYLPALNKLHQNPGKGLKILYITPLKALAKDLESALLQPIIDLELPYRVEKRTGDTTATKKAKQKTSPPEVLLITPESLALLLTDSKSQARFSNLQTIIIDEWHELLASKRGTLLELTISRLKEWSPEVQIWGLTATIANLQEAAQTCVGIDRIPTLVTASMPREVIVESILPESLEKLPWAGFLGIRMLPYVLKSLDPAKHTLIFTNTRSQAERWFQAIIEAKPEWKPIIALHHSSIDKKTRETIEEGIKAGSLSFVVCTSSLDLGIDLPEVEKVIQIGSPKSMARLIQRAGRSSHRPLTPCHISIVPTHALEVVELNGYKLALERHLIEERPPLKKCYDVLLQHITTCAIGGGFVKEELYKEIISTAGFSELTFDEFEMCLNFLISGGQALGAYDEYKKIVLKEGRYVVEDLLIIRRHKMNIGTITSDPYVPVKLLKGKTIGLIEESFLTHLKPGESFLFAGRALKLVQYRDMTAFVRVATDSKAQTVSWRGSRLPFSAPLGKVLREALGYGDKEHDNPILAEIVRLQQTISYLPDDKELLIEVLKSREGWHLFIYPFEGKTIHEGLGLLIAHRLSKSSPSTLNISCNDYGLELLSSKPFDELMLTSNLFSPVDSQKEVEELINLHEASKGCFRDIARISGLVFQGYPGKHKSNRQLQSSTGLLYEVLQEYDPENLLLREAKKEVLEKYFEKNRLQHILERLSTSNLLIKMLKKFSPFSLPLFVERVSDRLSTETLAERIQNIQNSWKK